MGACSGKKATETKPNLLTDQPESQKATAAVAADIPAAVPEDVVRAAVKAMEDSYNADDMAAAASIYAPECLVTMNGGVDGPFTGKTPAECAVFLGNLRNAMGGTNIKFTVSSIEVAIHQDTWTADNGTGSCKATWGLVGDKWLITADEILFTPTPAADSAPVAPGDALPAETLPADAPPADAPPADVASADAAAAAPADALPADAPPADAPPADAPPADAAPADAVPADTSAADTSAAAADEAKAQDQRVVEEVAVKESTCC